MKHLLKKEQILTIPNLLSLIRLLLIPVILWLYCEKQEPVAAAVVVALSGLTDIADGIIARRFHMVSDFGKLLDPVADKLTQGALILCLGTRYKGMLALILLFVLREACLFSFGYMTLKKKDEVNSARWYGKLSTVFLYSVMMILLLFPGISEPAVNTMIILCAVTVVFSLVMYTRYYAVQWAQSGQQTAE